MRRFLTLLALLVFLLPVPNPAQSGEKQWQQILQSAQGQTVYFNGWGGSDVINDYIRWSADELQKRYGVTLKHVKVTDIGEVVSRILAEKSGGRDRGGSVDLMWINGENFHTMKKNGLLLDPYAQLLPNSSLVDTENKKSTLYDFTVPVDNMEVPWGMAQLVFLYDTKLVAKPPKDMAQLLEFARSKPGRVTYPAPPNFYGTTFIKQALIELVADRDVLYKPVSEADFNKVTKPLWVYLDQLHPYLWRKGKAFPASAPEMKRLLNDGEIFISLSFNPLEASNSIATGELPETIRTYVHESGTIGNTHFIAIPYNGSAREGAMVVANFLLSPEAQARKSDPAVWGDPTVLSLQKLSAPQQALFTSVDQGIATLSPDELGQVLLEPHASWVDALEKGWLKRYSQ